MAQMLAKCPNIVKGICRETSNRYKVTKHGGEMNLWSTEFRIISWKYPEADHSHTVRRISEKKKKRRRKERGAFMVACFSSKYSLSSSSSSTSPTEELVEEEGKYGDGRKGKFGCLVREYGWKVRRMVEDQSEMRKVAQIQAQAFHVPVFLFNDIFFQFFQAEVLSALLYRLRNSPPDRYACLVAEPESNSNSDDDDDDDDDDVESDQKEKEEVVGVVDVTVLRDEEVLHHLPAAANEYLYVSGIAVLSNFRRKKVGTALLKACEKLCIHWEFEYLVLRAYEDDWGALELYRNAGYVVVSGDPPWMTSWIGRRRRVLMIKRP